jgi:Uma2 family endonuclease
MNVHLARDLATTQAADGLPRRAWTADEIKAMVQAGIIAENERLELIGGELVPMSPKGNRHELVKRAMQEFWFPRVVGTSTTLITETTLWINPTHFLEPDFVFWPRAVPIRDLGPANINLIVEIADTSLTYDTGRKAALFATFGIPEYWVINAEDLMTRIHRGPTGSTFASVTDHTANVLLTPAQLPALAVQLAALDLV